MISSAYERVGSDGRLAHSLPVCGKAPLGVPKPLALSHDALYATAVTNTFPFATTRDHYKKPGEAVQRAQTTAAQARMWVNRAMP